jgi:multidrug resistance efflux pump
LAKLQKGVSAEQKKIYDLQLAQAKLAVKRAERNLGKSKLMATCVCVVQDVNLNVGADSGGSGITLLNTSSLRFRTTNLSERDVVRMQLGQPATIRLKAFDQAFTGKVAAVLPLSSGAQNGAALYSVLIEVDVAGAGLLPGMTGQAEIEIGL